MFVWIALLLYLFVTLFPVTGFPKTLARRYETLVYPYSGLNPGLWNEFKRNIRAFENEEESALAARMLYSAIENVRDLALSVRRSDDHEIQDKLNDIASRLGVDGEYELYTSAKKKGFYFFPRYLNDIRDESTDAPEKGAVVGDPGTHFPDPRSHGQ